MRERPMAPLAAALRALGARVEGGGCPLAISGPATGGEIDLAADVSSQFASALLAVAPLLEEGLVLRLIGVPVSAPFIDLTIARMRERGVEAKRSAAEIAVLPGGYRARDVTVEGDATAASYFLAAAAITGGDVRVENVDATSAQGDLGVVEHLRAMGCAVETRDALVLRGPDRLAPLEADLSDISDTFPTLAVCCAFAGGESTLRGLAHTRVQESDRIHAVVTELRRLGGDVDELRDGVRIRPRPLRGAVVRTYRDHRIAMAFALVGLRVEDVAVADPECVAKTFPDYFTLLSSLARSSCAPSAPNRSSSASGAGVAASRVVSRNPGPASSPSPSGDSADADHASAAATASGARTSHVISASCRSTLSTIGRAPALRASSPTARIASASLRDVGTIAQARPRKSAPSAASIPRPVDPARGWPPTTRARRGARSAMRSRARLDEATSVSTAAGAARAASATARGSVPGGTASTTISAPRAAAPRSSATSMPRTLAARRTPASASKPRAPVASARDPPMSPRPTTATRIRRPVAAGGASAPRRRRRRGGGARGGGRF